MPCALCVYQKQQKIHFLSDVIESELMFIRNNKIYNIKKLLQFQCHDSAELRSFIALISRKFLRRNVCSFAYFGSLKMQTGN